MRYNNVLSDYVNLTNSYLVAENRKVLLDTKEVIWVKGFGKTIEKPVWFYVVKPQWRKKQGALEHITIHHTRGGNQLNLSSKASRKMFPRMHWLSSFGPVSLISTIITRLPFTSFFFPIYYVSSDNRDMSIEIFLKSWDYFFKKSCSLSFLQISLKELFILTIHCYDAYLLVLCFEEST